MAGDSSNNGNSAERGSLTRRGFVSGLGAMSAALGAEIVFGRYLPNGLLPVALAEETPGFDIPGKHPGLVLLNYLPVNAETPAHLLDDNILGHQTVVAHKQHIGTSYRIIEEVSRRFGIDWAVVEHHQIGVFSLELKRHVLVGE